ncbi:DUF5994 family protein [Nonomuraea antimicrobica]
MMTTFLSQSAPVPAAPIRLSLNPHLDRRGSVDGAWWPRTRTRDAAVELLVVPPAARTVRPWPRSRSRPQARSARPLRKGSDTKRITALDQGETPAEMGSRSGERSSHDGTCVGKAQCCGGSVGRLP